MKLTDSQLAKADKDHSDLMKCPRCGEICNEAKGLIVCPNDGVVGDLRDCCK